MAQKGSGEPSSCNDEESNYTCGNCGDSFSGYPSNNPEYCGKECFEDARGGIYRDESWLREKYVEEQLPMKKITELADCAKNTIYYWLDKHDIDRQHGVGHRVTEERQYMDAEWLREKYHEERLSTNDIAELCDTTKQTIREWMDKLGVEKRTRSEAAKVRLENHPEIKERFISNGIEAIRDMNSWEMWDKEDREAFKQRLSEERTGEGNPMYGLTGEENPNWKEDKAKRGFYASKKWKKTRKDVLERDGGMCQVCNKETDLHIHHITPISDGGAKYELGNLVTLCQKHHREWEGLYLRPDTR